MISHIVVSKHNLWWFQVSTKQIHIYTAIQLVCFALLIGVKLTVIAPSFPFFIICLIPLRKSLVYFFEENELEEVCALVFLFPSFLIFVLYNSIFFSHLDFLTHSIHFINTPAPMKFPWNHRSAMCARLVQDCLFPLVCSAYTLGHICCHTTF